jgi:hypothetical protein
MRRGVEFARPILLEPKEAAVAIEQKDLTGALFRIDEDRRKNDNWPTHDGYVIVDGRKHHVSAWVRTSKDGGKRYFSLALKPADSDKAGASVKPAAEAAAYAPAADDSIPF